MSLAFLFFFLFSFVGHLIGGAKAYSDELKDYGHAPVTPLQFLVSSHFWFQSFQNWQSEFLAVVMLSVYLREHGSPESKSVHIPHLETDED